MRYGIVLQHVAVRNVFAMTTSQSLAQLSFDTRTIIIIIIIIINNNNNNNNNNASGSV